MITTNMTNNDKLVINEEKLIAKTIIILYYGIVLIFVFTRCLKINYNRTSTQHTVYS